MQTLRVAWLELLCKCMPGKIAWSKVLWLEVYASLMAFQAAFHVSESSWTLVKVY